MIHMEESVVINAPPAEVFAVVTDFTNTPQWHKNMKKVGWRGDSPPGLGSEYDWVETFMGRTLDLSGSVTSWDPPHGFTWRPHGGPYPMTGGWTFAATGAGTTVTRTSDTELTGPARWMSGLMTRVARRQVRVELGQLKSFIESGRRSSKP